MKQRLLITGASGNLGRPLARLVARVADTTSTYFHNSSVGGGKAVQLDLRDQQAVMSLVTDLKPSAIIHAAVSERSEDSIATNRIAALNISQAAQKAEARLIALSTDLVFDGTNPPYSEDDPPTPLSPYGRVKADNELLLTSFYHNCLIVRTSLIYDLHPLNSQIRWLQEHIKSGKPISLFVDEIRQPIWAWNLAEILLELLAIPLRGILNVAGPQPLSRWDFGCALLVALGYNPTTVAQPTYAAQVAPHRPRNCTLSLAKAQAVLKTPLLDLDESLQRARARIGPQGHPISTTTRR